jgi:hypothetical protein
MPEENFPAKPKRLFTRRTVLTGIGGVVGAGALGVGGFLLVDKYDSSRTNPFRKACASRKEWAWDMLTLPCSRRRRSSSAEGA